MWSRHKLHYKRFGRDRQSLPISGLRDCISSRNNDLGAPTYGGILVILLVAAKMIWEGGFQVFAAVAGG